MSDASVSERGHYCPGGHPSGELHRCANPVTGKHAHIHAICGYRWGQGRDTDEDCLHR